MGRFVYYLTKGGGMKITRVLIIALALLWSTPGLAQVTSIKAKGGFELVKEDLVLAIQARGLIIDYTAHIGTMLERTGKDVGSAKKLYDKAEALQFCSAVVSRRTMEKAVDNIGYCPYVIALYTLPGDRDTVHIVTRKNLPEVDALLAEIVKEAVK